MEDLFFSDERSSSEEYRYRVLSRLYWVIPLKGILLTVIFNSEHNMSIIGKKS